MEGKLRPLTANNKPFVFGGIYNPNATVKPLIQMPLQAANVQEQQSPPVASYPTPATPVAVQQPSTPVPFKCRTRPSNSKIRMRTPSPRSWPCQLSSRRSRSLSTMNRPSTL
ncbi:uncharacterized protein LOC116803153 isoform X1 [Drosophila sechellia]|uniref:uncharacterized protein LOC116803153 isoform X1 n=1 Tax=Drosophila sechellia TaxID=7238 RepID=UPI0013DE74EE|nr:uncharacterized protein LOC116803153 isoform X1 [Drosophila sechellia]